MSDRPVHTVEVPLGDGSDEFVRVQIREVDDSLVRVGRGGRTIARAERSLGQMLDTVRPVAESFVGRFQGMAQAPDEITLEFGVSLSAEADVVIASTATAANFSVSLTWNRRDARDAEGDNSRQG
ncbi:CU044_2847 family protein [Streptomyces sp. NPDC056222]|uniref:CU044_2847 family protein n=1 Tax=Streptomyces sp. NPDC056222 TaxID=3345749 RepID=UPI0035D69CFA